MGLKFDFNSFEKQQNYVSSEDCLWENTISYCMSTLLYVLDRGTFIVIKKGNPLKELIIILII